MIDWFKEGLELEDQTLFKIWYKLATCGGTPQMLNAMLILLTKRVGRCTVEYFTEKNTEWMD